MILPVLCGRRQTLLPALSALLDVFLGLPFNIASYALLVHMRRSSAIWKWVILSGPVATRILQQPYGSNSSAIKPRTASAAKLIIKRKPESIFDYRFEDFGLKDTIHIRALKRRWLSNYEHPARADASVRRFFLPSVKFLRHLPEILQRPATA